MITGAFYQTRESSRSNRKIERLYWACRTLGATERKLSKWPLFFQSYKTKKSIHNNNNIKMEGVFMQEGSYARPCAQCQARHVACDRGRPCGRCLEGGPEMSLSCCDPKEAPRRRGRPPLTSVSYRRGTNKRPSPSFASSLQFPVSKLPRTSAGPSACLNSLYTHLPPSSCCQSPPLMVAYVGGCCYKCRWPAGSVPRRSTRWWSGSCWRLWSLLWKRRCRCAQRDSAGAA